MCREPGERGPGGHGIFINIETTNCPEDHRVYLQASNRRIWLIQNLRPFAYCGGWKRRGVKVRRIVEMLLMQPRWPK